MNYWLLTTEYPPFHGGGISTYCRFTAEMLVANGYRVSVIVADQSVRDFEYRSEGGNLHVLRFNPDRQGVPRELAGNAGLSYAFYLAVARLIVECGAPDVIESQDYLGIAYYIQQFRLLHYEPFSRIPIIVTLHAPGFVYYEYNQVPLYDLPVFWTCEMEKYSILWADLLIAPSDYIVGEIRRHMDLTENQLAVLPNPYTREVLPETSVFQRNRIVCFGKLSPQKGSLKLVEYFARLWEEGFEHVLEIYGDEHIVYHPAGQTMGAYVRSKYAEYIRRGLLVLHGGIKPVEIGRALAEAQVVLIPSITDNLPYACIEAMDQGKLVLASEQGGQRELIRDGENGFLFDHADPVSFGQKLRAVLALPDEAVYRVGRQARKSLDNLAFDIIFPAKDALIRQIREQEGPRHHFPFLHEEPACELPVNSGSMYLSVVIPFYNMGAYLDECIHSVRASTYRPMEIIVVNDGSNDPGSLTVLDRWRNAEGVLVHDTLNEGLAEARNTGARLAKGRYLAFLDADDLVEPAYYTKAIHVLDQYENVHFAGCWVRYTGRTRGIWPSFLPAPPYLLTHNSINSSALVYKRGAFLIGGLNDAQLCFGLEDYESVINMLHHGFNGVVLPECLYRYRVRDESMFRAMNKEKLLYSNKYISEKHRDYFQRYATEVVNLLTNNGPGYLYENPTLGISVTSTQEKPGGWAGHLRRLAKRNKRIKGWLLYLKRKWYDHGRRS